MADRAGATTPPPRPAASAKSPLTPDQVRRIEINRLKAKALRAQREAEAIRFPIPDDAHGTKRPHQLISRSTIGPHTSNQSHEKTVRDATNGATAKGEQAAPAASTSSFRPLDEIQPAKNFTKYVEYDFSKMTDTKGGFMTAEDDPYNKALRARLDESASSKPEGMSLREWEKLQTLKKLRDEKLGPYERSAEQVRREGRTCRECGSLDIDWKWDDVFKCAVCGSCRDKFPEKYSLLTKTEAKIDYLLTDAELKDEELLPHLERPNPHHATWTNMMLFLRYQLEEYAFSERKWGSAEGLDSAFEKREGDKRKRKQDRFKSKLLELKKKTRVEKYRRERAGLNGGEFGDEYAKGRHEHVWGRNVLDKDGVGRKRCVDCGMEVEELVF